MPARGAGLTKTIARASLCRELLAEHTAHRVTEQDWLRCDSFEKGLELIEVVGHADTDEGGALLVGTQAVADQVWGMASPTEPLERRLELIENPAAFIGAMDHHDVLGHCVHPLRLLS
jgi:hypothetical protein